MNYLLKVSKYARLIYKKKRAWPNFPAPEKKICGSGLALIVFLICPQ